MVNPASGWDFVVGEFSGSGKADVVGIHQSSLWIGKNTGSAFAFSDAGSVTQTAGMSIMPGDCNGDGLDDVVGYDPGLGTIRAGILRAETRLLVSVKRVLGPGGFPSPAWSIPTVELWVDDASAIFQQAGIELVLDEIVDFPDPMVPASWFDATVANMSAMESAAEGDPGAFAWRTDAINVYLVNDLDAGGICSFPTHVPHNDLILIQPNILNDSVGLAHEIGHYLSLRHTHANHEGAGAECPGGASGDCVSDTPDDADPGLCVPFTTWCHEANLAALGYPPEDYDTLRFNTMSYHGWTFPNEAILTPGQGGRARNAVFDYRTAMVQPDAVLSTASLNSPGSTSMRVSGAEPSNYTIFAFSLTTMAPLDTPFGDLFLAQPKSIGVIQSGTDGVATLPLVLPGGLAGIPIHFQALDLGTERLTNHLSEVFESGS